MTAGNQNTPDQGYATTLGNASYGVFSDSSTTLDVPKSDAPPRSVEPSASVVNTPTSQDDAVVEEPDRLLPRGSVVENEAVSDQALHDTVSPPLTATSPVVTSPGVSPDAFPPPPTWSKSEDIDVSRNDGAPDRDDAAQPNDVTPNSDAPQANDSFDSDDPPEDAPTVEQSSAPPEWESLTNPAPSSGVRRWLWRVSGGRYSPPPTAAELAARKLLDDVRRPYTGARTVAVISTKGGVGKTTTALNLGHTFASIRGDRVVALDANPDAGSLGYRVQRETEATALDLLHAVPEISGYADIRQFTSQASSRLEVIASPDDPRLTLRLGHNEYDKILTTLRAQYNLIIADCGTGILDSATQGVVANADLLVVVTSPSVDAARAVTYLLEWLDQHGFSERVSDAVVAINGVRPGQRSVNIDAIEEHFNGLVGHTIKIPYDDELLNGARVELPWLAPDTRQGYLRLAGALIDGFTSHY